MNVDTAVKTKTSNPIGIIPWLYGVLALQLGFLAMGAVFFVVAVPFLILIGAVIGLSIGFGAILGVDTGLAYAIALFLTLPLSFGFLLWVSARFFFPTYLALIQRVGWFLQRAATVTPSDTLGDVRYYASNLFADIAIIRRKFRRE